MSASSALWDDPPSLLDTSELSSQLDSSSLDPPASDSETELTFPSSSPSPSHLPPPHLTERQQLSYLLRLTQKPSRPHSRKPNADEGFKAKPRPPKPSLMSHDKKRRASPTPASPPPSYTVHSLPSQAAPASLPLPPAFSHWPAVRQRRFLALPTNPSLYYYHHPPPGVRERVGAFSALEKRWFVHLLKCHRGPGGGVEWGLFSLNLPGRTGKRCEEEWKEMVNRGEWKEGGKGAQDDFDYARWYEEVKTAPEQVWGTREEDGEEEEQGAPADGGANSAVACATPLSQPSPTSAPLLSPNAPSPSLVLPMEVSVKKEAMTVVGRKRVQAAPAVVEGGEVPSPALPTAEKKRRRTEAPPSKAGVEAQPSKQREPSKERTIAGTAAVNRAGEGKALPSVVVQPKSEGPPTVEPRNISSPSVPVISAIQDSIKPSTPPSSISSTAVAEVHPSVKPLIESITRSHLLPPPRITQRSPAVSIPSSAPSAVPLWPPTPPVFKSPRSPLPFPTCTSTLPPLPCPLPPLASLSPVDLALLRGRVQYELRMHRLEGLTKAERERAEGGRSMMMTAAVVLCEEYYGMERGTWTSGERERDGKDRRGKVKKGGLEALAGDVRRQFEMDEASLLWLQRAEAPAALATPSPSLC